MDTAVALVQAYLRVNGYFTEPVLGFLLTLEKARRGDPHG